MILELTLALLPVEHIVAVNLRLVMQPVIGQQAVTQEHLIVLVLSLLERDIQQVLSLAEALVPLKLKPVFILVGAELELVLVHHLLVVRVVLYLTQMVIHIAI